MVHPYENLPSSAFWRTGVAEKHPLDIAPLWEPKFPILTHHRIVTAGSCFAQHIGRALEARNYGWYNAEPAPGGLSADLRNAYGYGQFSFRTQNIYTTALLRQWIEWALGVREVPEEYWETENRYFDPFRPTIEPGGFESLEDMRSSRRDTITAIRTAISRSDIFVFTLGLTEGWVNVQEQYVYPMAPGTTTGSYNPDIHSFKNYDYNEVRRDLAEAIRLMKSVNKRLKFLLTVSPVPLTATASKQHVLTATTYSKSTLRAVAGDLASRRPDLDYFPSFEIITAPPYKGMFYENNLRSVSRHGVEFVMDTFFNSIEATVDASLPDARSNPPQPGEVPSGATKSRADTTPLADDTTSIKCEEELIAAFAPDRGR